MINTNESEDRGTGTTDVVSVEVVELAGANRGRSDDATDRAVEADAAPQAPPEAIVEALLFSSDVPITAARLAQLSQVRDVVVVREAVERLNADYEQRGAAFRIETIAKGYQMLTRPEYSRWVSRLHKARAESRLSAAALETLAVVAYKQPVVRAEIESVRGVSTGDMLLRLREMNLIRIVGRAEEIGRPLQYGTTNRFLEVFGLSSLRDLPKMDREEGQSIPTLRPVREE